MKVLAIVGLFSVASAFPQSGGEGEIQPREFLQNDGEGEIEPRAATCAKIPSWMKSDLTNRIVGGKQATGPIPWQVSMQQRLPDGRFGPFCGGTILDKNTVLSAAHCFVNKDGSKKPNDYFYAVAGVHDWYQGSQSEPQQAIKIAKFIWTTGKDQYNYQTLDNDIVIAKLSKPLTFNARVQPACLPAKDFFPDKKKAVVSGWGTMTYQGQSPQILRYVDAPLINDADCLKSPSMWAQHNPPQPRLDKILPSQLCAGYVDGTNKDSCQGDSGGPLVTSLSASDDSAVIVGVVSFGPQGCGLKGYPGIYAKVTNFLPWIKSNMGGGSGGGSSPPPSNPPPSPPPSGTGGTGGTYGGTYGTYGRDEEW